MSAKALLLFPRSPAERKYIRQGPGGLQDERQSWTNWRTRPPAFLFQIIIFLSAIFSISQAALYVKPNIIPKGR